jgi:AcrR family transcriptional regulator
MGISPDELAATAQPSSGATRAATARYARKKQAIVAAASEILNRDGVKGMTLANVAARVGLITTSVTYYFKKKEDLAVACFLDGIARFDELVSSALLEPTRRTRVLRTLDLWLELHRRIASGDSPAIPLFNDIRTLQKPQRTEVVDAYMRFFAKVRDLFIESGPTRLSEREITARAHILTEQIFWGVVWLPRYDVEDYGRVRDRMYDIFCHGLATSGRAWQPAPLSVEKMMESPGAVLTARETFFIAATRLINERGYRGASVEQISERLNVTKGSFYHHHDAKDDLVVECFKRSFEAMRCVQRAVAERGDHFEKLATAAAALVEFQLSERGPLLRASALTALPERIRNEMVEASNRVSDRFASIISDGIATGSVRAVDPYIAAQMLTATLNASAEINWWVPGVAREEAATLYAKPMLMGLLAEEVSAA